MYHHKELEYIWLIAKVFCVEYSLTRDEAPGVPCT